MQTFDIAFWLQLIALGVLLGAVGQALRVAVGLKKVNDEAEMMGVGAATMTEPSRIVASLLIGAAAGALTAIALEFPTGAGSAGLSTQQILGLIAAGYAGTDAIEAIMNRQLPGTQLARRQRLAAGTGGS